MSDSESDDDNYCYYGKALEPYDEDAFPKKRPITVEEQIATDAQGRRRFHGAFTGGFSAGFFNTVGSLEGWTPSEFKSSRSEKAESKQQKPEDYMDDEDIGEFGIAPQVVRATKEFNKNKRKKRYFTDGPIPGEPVLETLLNSGNETVGYLLLRNMGVKNRSKEDIEEHDEVPEGAKVYGCVMPKVRESSTAYECEQYSLPEIYKEYLSKPKSNSFGLGYSGLRDSHVNLFQNVTSAERNKKIPISGQAFGVGAFEDEDEDIYRKDNMSRYDFELTSETSVPEKKKFNEKVSVFDIFTVSKNKLSQGEYFPPPALPHSFSGKHKVRKSRFEPIQEETKPERSQMNAQIRARYLGEDYTTKDVSLNEQNKETEKVDEPKPKTEIPEPNNTLAGFANILADKFVSARQDDSQDILEPVKKTETEHGTKEMRDAAAMKMFGPLTRITYDWQPNTLLCKRFNVAEPIAGESASQKRRRTKHLIFEYQKETEQELHKPGLSVQKIKTEQTEEVTDAPEENTPQSENSSNQISDPVIQGNTSTNEVSPTDANISVDVDNPPPPDITERIDVAKNTDLFKAIFLSSDESDNEEEEVEKSTEDRDAALRTAVLAEQLLPKIKPTKKGILSGIDLTEVNKQITDTKREENSKTGAVSEGVCEASSSEVPGSNEPVALKNETEVSLYGPKLPDRIPSNFKQEVVESVEDVGNWIEKDEVGKRKSNKHKKKHKREKHEHKKKHKHKDKKNRQ